MAAKRSKSKAEVKAVSTAGRKHVQTFLSEPLRLELSTHDYTAFPAPVRITFTLDRPYHFRLSYHAYGDILGGASQQLITKAVIAINKELHRETEMAHEYNPSSTYRGHWFTSGETFVELTAGTYTVELLHKTTASNWASFVEYTAENVRLSCDWIESE